jgi:hypothetical protein
VQLHIALDEWSRALSLSRKSGNIELLSVLSFAYCDCSPCYQHIEELCAMIHENSLRVISVHELLWILTLSILAKMTLKDAHRYPISDLIMLLENEEMADATGALKAFLVSDFTTVVWFVEHIDWIAQRSLFICFSCESVKKSVTLNCIAQYCCPFRALAFREIAHSVGIPQDTIGDLIVAAVDEGLIVGRIDFVGERFERVSGQADWNRKREILDDALIVRLKTESETSEKVPIVPA